MSASGTCTHCGSSEIDIDPARGDAVCTNCGSVLEENAIVSEVQFEENAHGGSSALGQFVSSDSKGGGSRLIPGFRAGIRKESREITLKNAKSRISHLASMLRLNQHCIDTAFNFFKMALARRLTCGRKSLHVVAACLYITCRTEGTAHMLIDFSDALQTDPYELGRTYSRLANALCINIPALDPCIYILRFANKLEFGDKTHDVSMTALRVVQRMKRDWMDTGRRPAGLCGAALLIASRLHDFNRTIDDVVNVVRVRQSTLKKRLIEFAETPSSSLTSHEFMQIDLEEEQDPPCFKTARKKDKEKLQKLYTEQPGVDEEFYSLTLEIEKVLEMKSKKYRGEPGAAKEKKTKKKKKEEDMAALKEEEIQRQFIAEESMNTVKECFSSDVTETPVDYGSNVIVKNLEEREAAIEYPLMNPKCEVAAVPDNGGLLDLKGIDDDEIDAYIRTDEEVKVKSEAWMEMHGEFLKEQEEKRKRQEQEEKEGKGDKKRKKRKKKEQFQAHNPGEAIEKMLAEKKISSKINYDVLRSLIDTDKEDKSTEEASSPVKEPEMPAKKLKTEDVKKEAREAETEDIATTDVNQSYEEEVDDDDREDDYEDEPLSAAQLLSQHQEEFQYL